MLVLTFILRRMIHDKKLLGVCGETELANAKQSLITMMQVCYLSNSNSRAYTHDFDLGL